MKKEQENNKKPVEKKLKYNSEEFLTLVNDTDDDMEYMSPHKYYDKQDSEDDSTTDK